MKYPIAQAVLTRRCNLNCGYCEWVRGAERYPDRSFVSWRPYLDWMVENSHHLLLIGGEPTIHPDFDAIVGYLASRGMSFSVSSNAAFTTKDDLSRWRRLGLYNWSVSVDTVTEERAVDTESLLKSNRGLRSLEWAREIGYTDLHANITLSRANLGVVVELAKWLTARGIWVSIGTLSWAKGEGYDVWPTGMEALRLQQGDELFSVCNRLAEWAEHDPLAHNNEPGHFADLYRYAPTLSWRCDWPAIIFDADCRLRLCRDIRGEAVPVVDVLSPSFNDLSRLDLWAAWEEDVENLCEGCFWDCHWATCYWLNRGGGEHFTHGQDASS